MSARPGTKREIGIRDGRRDNEKKNTHTYTHELVLDIKRNTDTEIETPTHRECESDTFTGKRVRKLIFHNLLHGVRISF